MKKTCITLRQHRRIRGARLACRLFGIFLTLALTVTITTGCRQSQSESPFFPKIKSAQEHSEPASQNQQGNDNAQETTTPNFSEFLDVYNEYKEELLSKTNVLVSEIISQLESSKNQDSDSVSDIIDSKASELSQIYTQGLSELVLTMKNTKADYSEYEHWAKLLADDYNFAVSKLHSCYYDENFDENEDIDY